MFIRIIFRIILYVQTRISKSTARAMNIPVLKKVFVSLRLIVTFIGILFFTVWNVLLLVCILVLVYVYRMYETIVCACSCVYELLYIRESLNVNNRFVCVAVKDGEYVSFVNVFIDFVVVFFVKLIFFVLFMLLVSFLFSKHKQICCALKFAFIINWNCFDWTNEF